MDLIALQVVSGLDAFGECELPRGADEHDAKGNPGLRVIISAQRAGDGDYLYPYVAMFTRYDHTCGGWDFPERPAAA